MLNDTAIIQVLLETEPDSPDMLNLETQILEIRVAVNRARQILFPAWAKLRR